MDFSHSYYEYKLAAHFLVTDEDAADFLQSQFTNDLRPFEAGRSTYGLWLDVKGKVIADSVVLCEGGERFRVLSELCPGEQIAAHLERHIIADDVAIEHCDPGFVFELPPAGVQALGCEFPACGRFVRVEDGILYSSRSGRYHLTAASEASREAIHGKLSASGWTALSRAERGLARIAAGIPLVPMEVGHTDLPGEGELERDAVSFTKGCYLGQEVVARMHNIGKPQRRLFIVQGSGAAPEPPLEGHNTEGKQLGELRSAYPHADGWSGVALLKTRFTEVGAQLRVGSDTLSVLKPLREGFVNE
jgi:folate-binding protein YgfZ